MDKKKAPATKHRTNFSFFLFKIVNLRGLTNTKTGFFNLARINDKSFCSILTKKELVL